MSTTAPRLSTKVLLTMIGWQPRTKIVAGSAKPRPLRSSVREEYGAVVLEQGVGDAHRWPGDSRRGRTRRTSPRSPRCRRRRTRGPDRCSPARAAQSTSPPSRRPWPSSCSGRRSCRTCRRAAVGVVFHRRESDRVGGGPSAVNRAADLRLDPRALELDDDAGVDGQSALHPAFGGGESGEIDHRAGQVDRAGVQDRVDGRRVPRSSPWSSRRSGWPWRFPGRSCPRCPGRRR